MSIREALQLKSIKVTLSSGLEIILRRPNTLDLLAAIEHSKKTPETFAAWLVWNHLMDNSGKVFASIEEVLTCDVAMIDEIANEANKLYGEGKN
jgi:hypothetical protein